MLEDEKFQSKPLDPEWVYLILLAKELGLQIEEIRQFFNSAITEEVSS